MCGLSAFYVTNDLSNGIENKLEQSLELIKHRGPDYTGSKIFTSIRGKVGLGHVRLSIIDLSDFGNQPMYSPCGKVVMIFNGEIYNYLELRKKLPDYHFISDSDSEVLIASYLNFGKECFKSLRGMFTAIFYHIDKDELVVVRDQIGVKPLYYINSCGCFFFSSEIKGLFPFKIYPFKIDKNSLYEFLSCGFVYEPNTGFEGVFKIPAGSYAVIKNCNMEIVNYFDLSIDNDYKVFSDKLITNAISGQLVSDANLGVFFSGGVDSSVIASIAKKENIFAKYSEDDFVKSGIVSDEPYADLIAQYLGLKVIKEKISDNLKDADQIISSIKSVVSGNEELISDYTYVASAELSKIARDNGYKVMLSGMGADEVFFGYPRYEVLLKKIKFFIFFKISQLPLINNFLKKNNFFGKKISRLASFFHEKEFALKYARLLGYFSSEELIGLMGENNYSIGTLNFLKKVDFLLNRFSNEPEIIKAFILDYHGFLSHNLMVADKSSMQFGVELRVPFLDQDLYVSTFNEYRSGKKQIEFGKKDLKKLLLKYLPKSVVNRKKTGFNPPLDSKITAIGKDLLLEIFTNGTLSSYLCIEQVLQIVENHFEGRENNTYKIWQLLFLNYWLENNLKIR